MTSGPRPSARHMPALDGIRGLAIVAVMVSHFLPRGGGMAEAYFWAIPALGWHGVDLFFALSGFLITGILYDTKGSAGWLFTFYARRVLRIFPLYFLFLAVLFAALPLLAPTRPEEVAILRENSVWYWTYLINIRIAFEGVGVAPLRTGHLWSLAVEEQFYMLWPWMVLLLSRRNVLRLCGVLLAAAVALRVLVYFTDSSMVAPGYFTLTRWDGIVMGSALALWVRGPRGWNVLPPILRLRRPLFYLGAALLGVMLVDELLPPLLRTISPTACAVGFAALVAYGALAGDGRARFLKGRVIEAFGRYSYGLYIVHFPVLLLLELTGVREALSHDIAEQVAFVGLAIGASLALAVPLWHGFEQPILQLKRFVTYRQRSRAPEAEILSSPAAG